MTCRRGPRAPLQLPQRAPRCSCGVRRPRFLHCPAVQMHGYSPIATHPEWPQKVAPWRVADPGRRDSCVFSARGGTTRLAFALARSHSHNVRRAGPDPRGCTPAKRGDPAASAVVRCCPRGPANRNVRSHHTLQRSIARSRTPYTHRTPTACVLPCSILRNEGDDCAVLRWELHKRRCGRGAPHGRLSRQLLGRLGTTRVGTLPGCPLWDGTRHIAHVTSCPLPPRPPCPRRACPPQSPSPPPPCTAAPGPPHRPQTRSPTPAGHPLCLQRETERSGAR